MPAMTIEELQKDAENADAVIKTLVAVFAVAPDDAPVPGPITTDGVTINSFPEEYTPVGMLTTEGISGDKEVNFDEVEALGHFTAVRRDPTSGTRSLTVNAFEIHNRQVVELSDGVDLSSHEVDPETGEVSWTENDIPSARFYRGILIAYDGSLTKPIFDGRFYPKLQVTTFPSESWQKEGARTAAIGFSIYNDDELGYPVKKTVAGLKFLEMAERLNWQIGAA